MLLIPPATLATVPEFGAFTLEYVQNLNGIDTTRSLSEWILGIGVDDVVSVDHETWSELVEPLGGLTLSNPDPLSGADGVVFPAGEITLAPDQVGPSRTPSTGCFARSWCGNRGSTPWPTADQRWCSPANKTAAWPGSCRRSPQQSTGWPHCR